jgi:DNA-binding response OmpR family regulator
MRPLILLVDDNEEILEFLGRYLSEKYEVMKATNGKQGLERLQEKAVHLVISDVMMPEMDGFELCDIIKTTFEYSHIPVILLTAKNTLQSKMEGLEQGADAYIEKPFSPEYLQVQIANLLANRNKIKEYFAHSPLVNLKSIAYSKEDETFLERLNHIIEENLEEVDLDVEKLAYDLNISRTTLYRKIKSISDLSPNELINITRLKKAAAFLATCKYRIYEVADMVGYNSSTNFTRIFFKQFGMTPTDYQHLKQNENDA